MQILQIADGRRFHRRVHGKLGHADIAHAARQRMRRCQPYGRAATLVGVVPIRLHGQRGATEISVTPAAVSASVA